MCSSPPKCSHTNQLKHSLVLLRLKAVLQLTTASFCKSTWCPVKQKHTAGTHWWFMNLHDGKMKRRRGWQEVHDDTEVGPHRLVPATELCANRFILQKDSNWDAGQQYRGCAITDSLLFKQKEPTENLTPTIYCNFENQMHKKPERCFYTMC